MGATGQLEKAVQRFRELLKTFPESGPRAQLGYTLTTLGRNEEAVAVENEAIQFAPNATGGYVDLIWACLNLERPAEARAASEQARARNVNGDSLRNARYGLAFIEGDEAAMQEQLTWALSKPGGEDYLLSSYSNTQAYYGRFEKARRFSQQAVDSAKQIGSQEGAAAWRATEALREAEAGNAARARQVAAETLALSQGRDVAVVVALTLARAGDPLQAEQLADKLNRQFPLDTILQNYSLPAIRASIELGKKNPRQAIRLLQTSTLYELAAPPIAPNLYPAYVRGQAYLQAGKGRDAAAEFQMVINHRGLMGNFVNGALAHLQLGRAQVMMGDQAAARKSYQDFLTLWKDADADIPIYKQAKAEYAKLR